MMMAAASSVTEDNGFNFDFMGHLFDGDDDDDGFNNGGIGDDTGDIAIDVDSFYKILDEDLPQQQQQSDEYPLPELPTNPFYPSTYNSQESGSTAHAGNDENLLFLPVEANAETVEAMEKHPCPSPAEMLLGRASEAIVWKNDLGTGFHESPNFTETECFPTAQNWLGMYNMSASTGYFNQNSLDAVSYGATSSNEAKRNLMNRNFDDSQSRHLWINDKPDLGAQMGGGNFTSEASVYNFLDGRAPESILPLNHSAEQFGTGCTYDSSSTTTDEASTEPSYWGSMGQSSSTQVVGMKDEKPNELHSLYSLEGKPCLLRKHVPFEGLTSSGAANFIIPSEAHYFGRLAGRPDVLCHADKKPTGLQLLESSASFGNSCFTMGGEAAAKIETHLLCDASEECKISLFEDKSSNEAADDDLCVIEDMSAPAHSNPVSVNGRSVPVMLSAVPPGSSPLVTPFHQVGVTGARLKATDERLIFQAVVQGLSQPRSEATPPDGLLAVPLLRHQRIALSWMVQKETTSLQCSGGILADDQGLGKTVSTIALILAERPLSSSAVKRNEQGQLEMLNLDEDDNEPRSKVPTDSAKASSTRGRPSAGTLIVCPTSVLRQWADELRNKVTSNANLSVCIYHGNTRTKDPYELAKHDVVLTTYSIVSMEVPKQPVVVKDGIGKQELQEDDSSAPSRKRKHSASVKKRSKREIDSSLLDSVSRPLARVGWFRVVLDEAQSIKNHRTQVAQACWGLRAKRRWCLSGTPIQNAVDDLYSYFRFLRYDPYSVYNSFCSLVKLPISKHPSSGYKKLQAVLKTVMLRRTKGTLLDGEPIIKLPPKSVKLKKVDFSEEERDFYTRLEADSRAQFQAYADSGTVKQNYVNILLMLLRLRQACDHPFLVKGYDSSSILKPSITLAKKLSRDQQIKLLTCLEASLALCSVCSDPPEDAVVSICGHVFCNQCISEQLTGDDNQCPFVTCKSQLNMSSVFPKGTLESCLSNNFSEDGSNDLSASESSDQGELVEPSPKIRFDSSKIRAALEVLQSLSKRCTPFSETGLMDSAVNNDVAFDKSDSASYGSENESCVKEKAIVFSQWTRMLDLLEDSLKESSIVYRRLDGTMSVAARDKAVKDFNTLPEVTVIIMSLKAASLGLNMVAACHVLLLDLWWNPTTEDQAIDRAHRIGQTRPVTVVRLTVKDTVEDRILALQQKKRQLVASAFGEDERGSRQTRLTVEDLKYLFMA